MHYTSAAWNFSACSQDIYASRIVCFYVFHRPQTVMLYCLCDVFSTCVCVCAHSRTVGGGGGGGLGLCRPRVISRDQASLMSAGSSRGTQALPTPSSPSPGTFWLHTAPCWTDSPNFTYLIPPFKQLQRILTYNLSLLCFYIYLSYTFYPLCF